MKKTIEEVRDWLLENRVNERGDLDLMGLDFGNFEGGVDISCMSVKKKLWQGCQEVKGDLYQDEQKVGGNLYQDEQDVKGNIIQDEEGER